MAVCAVCLGEALVTHVDVPACELGLPSGQLRGVERITCASCGEASLSVPAHGAVMKQYRLQLARIDRELTADEFAYLRRALRVSGQDYAEALRITNVTISRLENGANISALQDGMIRVLTHLDILTLDALALLINRSGSEVSVNVRAVESNRPREVSGGWRTLDSEAWPANVVPLRPGVRGRHSTVITRIFEVDSAPVVLADGAIGDHDWMLASCK